jgi:hypothetical protein
MALTNNDASKLAQNIVTDVNANVSTPSAPERVLSREAAILFNKSIVARPLMVPEVCSIRVKNTEYAYRWVNRSSSNGQFYMMRKAQGFVNATTDDVELLGGDAVANKGEITAGDLILMKIRADLYDAALKFNLEKAMAYSRARGVYMEGGSSDVNSDSTPKRVSVANEPFSKTGLAQPFIPDNPDAIVEDSIKSGRAEEARKAVEGLRKAQSK